MASDPKPLPWSLRLVIAFLLPLSACHLVLLLHMCLAAVDGGQHLFMNLTLHGLMSLLCLLLGVHILLRLPLARASAVVFLLALPAVKAFRYVLAPLEWQIAGAGRAQEVVAAIVYLTMVYLLLRPEAAAFLKTARRPPPPGPGVPSEPPPPCVRAPPSHTADDPVEP